jgi:protein-disulfide isomerase
MSPHPKLRVPVNDSDHALGPKEAPIELVEYGDFQCPHCGHAYPIVERLRENLGRELRFIYRHFPLSESHPDARNAARAAEAAGRQGRFWEMHALLFKNQDALDPDSLTGYAAAMGLDMEQWAGDFESGPVLAKLDADFRSGVRSGANGTPTFFLNGYRYDGDWSYGPFLEAMHHGASLILPPPWSRPRRTGAGVHPNCSISCRSPFSRDSISFL